MCRWLSCLLLLTAACVHSANVSEDYLLDVWTPENGLPDSSVTSIVQTPDGYLWIGTYNGLARFDGVRFVTFDPANTPTLRHARVRKLFVDACGTLWINTQDGSLTTFRDGVFSLQHSDGFGEGETYLISTSSNQVTFLNGRGELFIKNLSAPPGEGWKETQPPSRELGINAICCQDGQGDIWYLDSQKHLWRLDGNHYERITGEGLGKATVNCMTTDAHQSLWLGTDEGIWTREHNQFQLVLPVHADKTGGVTFIKVDQNDQVWAAVNGGLGMASHGRWMFEPSVARYFFSRPSSRIGAQDDDHGGEWFYSYGGGLLHVDANGQVWQLTTEEGFPGERVYCFFADREGNWWAGLDSGGLVRVRARQFHVVATKDKTLTKAAKSVTEDSSGKIWIGILNGGLGCWQNGIYTNYAATRDVGGGSVFCVCPENNGRLWLSAGEEDLFIRDMGKIDRWQPVIHGVKTILRDHSGCIWVGTTTALLYSKSGKPEDLQPFGRIPRRNIRTLTEDASGVLWVGTGSGEIYKVLSNSATLFRPDDEQTPAAVWSLLVENNGTLWAGTFRGGLLRLKDGKFTRYNKDDGLPDNIICQILDDNHGNLWIGSHQGVFRVAKADLNDFADGKINFIPCINYARADGLPSLECSGGYQPAACRDREGRLWFTTARGPTWILPDEIRQNPTPPPVVIEEILVDGRVHTLPGSAMQNTFEIPPGRHQIEFRYAGLSLASPKRVRFRYRLSSVDNDWVQAGIHRSVQYNLLPPGEYTFRVIACNSDGVWNTKGAGITFRILPHFYETWWFRALALFTVLATVAGIVRHTATRRLHQQMEVMQRRQAVERERARIAKDIHDDLGANLTLIAVLGDLAKREKAAERIEKMSGTAREAVKSLDEIVWAVNPRNDTLAHLIDYMGQFATDYLRDAGIRCLLDVPDHTPAREVPANVRHNVFLVVKEALQNIVKHAHATEAWLHVSTTDDGLRIAVEDNGRGFDKAPEDAWADGLRNMRQRLAEIGGRCNIESNLGKGTVITVELPLREVT